MYGYCGSSALDVRRKRTDLSLVKNVTNCHYVRAQMPGPRFLRKRRRHSAKVALLDLQRLAEKLACSFLARRLLGAQETEPPGSVGMSIASTALHTASFRNASQTEGRGSDTFFLEKYKHTHTQIQVPAALANARTRKDPHSLQVAPTCRKKAGRIQEESKEAYVACLGCYSRLSRRHHHGNRTLSGLVRSRPTDTIVGLPSVGLIDTACVTAGSTSTQPEPQQP